MARVKLPNFQDGKPNCQFSPFTGAKEEKSRRQYIRYLGKEEQFQINLCIYLGAVIISAKEYFTSA